MKYIVETIQTFREVHVVEAENEEIAKQIAEKSDYNMSKWLGTQVASVYSYTDEHLERFKQEDQYFWAGVKSIDEEGWVCYQMPGGERYRNDMNDRVIVEK